MGSSLEKTVPDNPPDGTRAAINTVYRFGPFEVHSESGELFRDSVRVRLQEQSLQVLLALLEKPGMLVSRDQMQVRLWPEGTHVDFEHSLNAAVKRLRAALEDDADNPRYIETLPRRGYRLIVEVKSEVASGSVGTPQSAIPIPEMPSETNPRNRLRQPLVWGIASLVVLLVVATAILTLHKRRASSALFNTNALIGMPCNWPPIPRPPNCTRSCWMWKRANWARLTMSHLR
jgi:DNA-binding winged helix-turn-helix (wHTH) protein